MKIMTILDKCNLCTRRCNVNRNAGQLGYVVLELLVKAARAQLHFWEEPCISGENGSRDCFLFSLQFKCVFCQNHEISQEYNGKEITIERLAEIFLELQAQGANNINLVTPTHMCLK